jgi:hypothetical protein
VSVSADPSTAEIAAGKNLGANLAALWQTQPRLAEMVGPMPRDFEWVYGRDGFLTAVDGEGKWWAGCSLPLAAGRSLLKTLEPSTLHNCMLDPAHAGLLRAAFARIGDEPALLAVVPEMMSIRMILCCDDFSEQIAAHRLWFISGQDWPDDFRRLLEERPGLCTPGRFIRTKLLSDQTANLMITQAQNVFSEVLQQRTRRIEQIRTQEKNGTAEKILLIAGSHFRLWDSAATVLAEQIQSAVSVHRFDSDDPAESSPLALAEAAADCRAVIAANVSRGDASNLVAMNTPWITWVTGPRVPSFTAAGPRDLLMVADSAWEDMAVGAGWPKGRVMRARWPATLVAGAARATLTLAILADTQVIEIPDSIADLSSHKLLWDHIEAELHDDPLALGEDVGGYLAQRARMYEISTDAIDRRRFVENLIVPAYQQGLARLLLKAGLPLRLSGLGWDEIDEFRAVARGPVRSRQDFEATIAAASALVYVWPMRHAHPIDTFGKPVIQRTGRRAESFIAAAKAAMKTSSAVAVDSSPTVGSVISKILSSLQDRGYDVAAA